MPPAVDLKVGIFAEPKNRSISPKVRALSIQDRVQSGKGRKSGYRHVDFHIENSTPNYVNLPDPKDLMVYRDFP